VPVSIDFLSGLYNRHSCYADRLTLEQLETILVATPVETTLRQWIKGKKDVVLTGNPGDGKTFLLRRLNEEIAKVKGDQVLDATSEKDYSTIVTRWRKARKAKRPFFLAINHGRLTVRVCRPEMEETDPYFAFAAFDLFHPPLRRIHSRHAAPETSDIEIERLVKGVRAALKRLAGTERRGSVLCHDRSIRTFDSPSNAMWVGKWVGCFCAHRL
jgi:KaiC/GvpD/RAD55 family RecA-like ATPase